MNKEGLKGTVVHFTDAEREILKGIGKGSMAAGIRLSIVWAAHFYQLGLTDEMNLDCIGLVTVSSTDKHPHE
jgi:hypothetical protein